MAEVRSTMTVKFSRCDVLPKEVSRDSMPVTVVRGSHPHFLLDGEPTVLHDGSGCNAPDFHFLENLLRHVRTRTCIILLVAVLGALSVSFAAGAGSALAATADVADIIPPYNPQLDAVGAPAGVFGTGKIWHVGPSEQYKMFSSIAGQLHDGDVVEIDAGTYGCTEQSIA
jgi:hypothetical protein